MERRFDITVKDYENVVGRKMEVDEWRNIRDEYVGSLLSSSDPSRDDMVGISRMINLLPWKSSKDEMIKELDDVLLGEYGLWVEVEDDE